MYLELVTRRNESRGTNAADLNVLVDLKDDIKGFKEIMKRTFGEHCVIGYIP